MTRLNTDKATTAIGSLVLALTLVVEVANVIGHSKAGLPVGWSELALTIAALGRFGVDFLTNKSSFSIGKEPDQKI